MEVLGEVDELMQKGTNAMEAEKHWLLNWSVRRL